MSGEEMRALRKSLDLGQAEFAKALGITPQFVGMMERGERPIEHRTVLAARYLSDHPEILADLPAPDASPSATLLARIHAMLVDEPRNLRDRGSLESFRIDSSGDGPTTLTIRFRK